MRLRTSLETVLLVCLALALGAHLAYAIGQEPANKFTLILSTDTMLMPFKMPAMPAGVALPPGFHMPDFSAPKRNITGEAHYPNAAVEPIFVTVPADLGLPNNQLPLLVPQPPPSTPGQPGQGGQGQTQSVKYTTMLYWHPDTYQGPVTNSFNTASMPAMRPGQPPAIPTSGGVDWAAELARTASGNKGDLPKTVVGQGNYVLNTGGLTAPLDGFLPPLLVTAPDDLKTVDLTQPLTITWKPVAGARGFILHARGMVMNGQNDYTMIQWVSTLAQPPERVRDDYRQETTIADDLQNGILLPPDTTQCVMPGGMFPANLTSFTLAVTAVGNDFYSQENGVTIVGTIRAKWTAMKMGGMGAPPQQ
jgi:hypothetical protein